jgi:3-methylcrotonyl-CoA carboxylase alpha subunit
MITKQDLVHWQLKVAAGEPLPLTQSQLQVHGHAFEARIYAENPGNNFLPDAGAIAHLRQPQQDLPHVRIDTGVLQGDQVGVYYDPMIAKLIVWDANGREPALRRLRNALGEFQVNHLSYLLLFEISHARVCVYVCVPNCVSSQVVGFETNIEFLKRLSANPAFAAGDVETGFIAKRYKELFPEPVPLPPHAVALAMLYSIVRHRPTFLFRIPEFDIACILSFRF